MIGTLSSLLPVSFFRDVATLATSGGREVGSILTSIPIPRTMKFTMSASESSSISIPATFLPLISRSLGHFISGRIFVVFSIALAAATAARSVICEAEEGAILGLRIIDV